MICQNHIHGQECFCAAIKLIVVEVTLSVLQQNSLYTTLLTDDIMVFLDLTLNNMQQKTIYLEMHKLDILHSVEFF